MKYATTGDGPNNWADVGTLRPLGAGRFDLPVGFSDHSQVRYTLHDADKNPIIESHSLPLMWTPTDDERSAWKEWFRRHGIDMDRVYTPTKITRDLRQYRVTYENVLGEPVVVQLEGLPLPFPPLRWHTGEGV